MTGELVPVFTPRNLRLRWLPPDEPPHFFLQLGRGQTAQEDRPCPWSPSVTPAHSPVGGRTPVIMHLVQVNELCQPEANLKDPIQAQGPGEAQLFGAEGEEDVASPSSSSPSSSSSSPSSSSSSSPSSSEAPRLKMADLVRFLLLKYRTKEPTTTAEMLTMVRKDQRDHFPVVFSQACNCMQLLFGVDMKEVDPREHTYALVPTLGLTHNGMLSDGQRFPKTGLLVLLLGLIVLDGDHIPEEEAWGALSRIGVYAGKEHCIYGDPGELLTKVWVQEGYLEYRQVPHSDPARYEFLWGPRAHAEIRREQVQDYLLKVNSLDPRSFLPLPAEAVSDEEEGA
ncbi:melanoma-associated antigen 10-like [Hippopotamus amphibius kiboko]|uniref:melanoma-associated antigen 10-like n=1 Tax=Hippopotamus amphibius kiboko TaxID=575201 RepID=UPI00259203A1|nr:melanoma-associated antigen 10-like [Hippopotamus amphibius kiboko]